jgi:hypothetical protein
MSRKSTPPEPRPVGRPKSTPDGTRIRGFRVTDAEWSLLKAYLAKLRGRRKSNTSGTGPEPPG